MVGQAVLSGHGVLGGGVKGEIGRGRRLLYTYHHFSNTHRESPGNGKSMLVPILFIRQIIFYAEAAIRGGQIIASGTPEAVAKVKESYTGQYLAKVLK